MSQDFDVSLKTIFLREGDGILRRLLFGGRVVDAVATEQPQVSNRRADLVVRTEDGSLHHVEFQTRNEAKFGLRMLEYYVYFVRAHDVHVEQTVSYLGREPLHLEPEYRSPSMDFRFEIVNLREYDAAPLRESEDWADNLLAVLAKGEPEKALDVVLPRFRAMREEERSLAASTLVLLSGIIGLARHVEDRLKEVSVID